MISIRRKIYNFCNGTMVENLWNTDRVTALIEVEYKQTMYMEEILYVLLWIPEGLIVKFLILTKLEIFDPTYFQHPLYSYSILKMITSSSKESHVLRTARFEGGFQLYSNIPNRIPMCDVWYSKKFGWIIMPWRDTMHTSKYSSSFQFSNCCGTPIIRREE